MCHYDAVRTEIDIYSSFMEGLHRNVFKLKIFNKADVFLIESFDQDRSFQGEGLPQELF